MEAWSRREVLKGGMGVVAGTALGRAASSDPVPPVMASHGEGEAVGGFAASPALRERLLLDFGWRFHFGHASDPNKDFGFGGGGMTGFQKTGNFLVPSHPTFDDSDWESLDLPHDWAIGLPFHNDPSLSSKGFYPLGRAYPETSVGWYRHVFELPAEDAGRRLSIEFDGAYRDTMVVFNGFYLGRHSGGYDPFHFDLTDFALPGRPNVLLVRVDATLSDGWFYEGAGLYRHVWLAKTAPVHVKKWGTFARAQVQSGRATVLLRTEVENHSHRKQRVRVHSTILDPSGQAVAHVASAPFTLADGEEHTLEQQANVRQPALWSLEEPHRYTLVTEVEADGALTDRVETRFGIRSLAFDPERGFFLNGKAVKVKGTCNHQDHAGLGVALPDAVQRYRVRKLQEMGCNAYRTAHNPPSPELLEACDEMGMLVFDETRMMSSNPEGLAQFENLIRRDRNHPSVFLWSMGNEEHEAATEFGRRILTHMKRIAEAQDGSRPVSIAPPPFGGLGMGGLAVLDVMGYNYADPAAEQYHREKPKVPILGSENVSAVGTRGIYVTGKGFVGSYDPYTTTGRASAEGWWRFCHARPWLAGGFVWTGFDYRGEPSPYDWPNISSQYGILDTCGFPKDTFYYYQAWWTPKPVLHLFPHWNWPGFEGKEIAVWVHSNLDRVELLHNGRSLGVKEMPKDSHLAWNVPYAPGSLEARGYKEGRLALTIRRETTGPPAKLALTADRQEMAADGEDVVMLAVEVQDAQGRVVPVTDNEVTFRVSGAGRLRGVGNGDPTSHESDIGTSRRAFSGRCLGIVQSAKTPGKLRIEAMSPGLESASMEVTARPVTLRPQVALWERPVPIGTGVTGLWRTVPAPSGAGGMLATLFGGGNMVVTLHQNGAVLTGMVEAPGGFFGETGTGKIEDGRAEGNRLAFRVGDTDYTGTIQGEEIALHKGPPSFLKAFSPPPKALDHRPPPAIGPPPDGSDPSFPAMDFSRMALPPIKLRRARR